MRQLAVSGSKGRTEQVANDLGLTVPVSFPCAEVINRFPKAADIVCPCVSPSYPQKTRGSWHIGGV